MTIGGDGDVPDHVDGPGATRLAGVGQEDSKAGLSEGRSERLPLALLAVAMVLSAWLGLSLNSGFSFINDEWDPLLNRSGWGLEQIFAPFNGHPTMIPMVIYKSAQEVFGMDSTRPVQLVHATLLLVMNGVLFVYLRRRVGDWAALIGTVIILFLGAAFEVLLFSFTINFTGAMAAGIGALLMLDRDDRKGDLCAAALLVLGACVSMVILPFVAAAAFEWAINPRDRRSRIFVPGAVLLFLFIWWIIWGSTSEQSSVVLSNVLSLPENSFKALGSGFASLFGLATGDGSEPEQPNLIWGKLIAIAVVALGCWRLLVIGRPLPKDFLIVGVTFLAYLVILGMSEDETRQPTFSRFQLPTAIFILMTASTLLREVRLKTSWLIAAAVVAALSIQGGIGLMTKEAKGQWTVASQYFRSYLTGIELSGRDAFAGGLVNVGPWVTISPSRYLETAAEHGSPAFDRTDFESLGQNELYWLDTGLIVGSGIRLDAEPPNPNPSNCTAVRKGRMILTRFGRYRIENRTREEVTIFTARLGPLPGTSIGAVLPDSVAGLTLPAGELTEPWLVSFEPGSGRIRLCGP